MDTFIDENGVDLLEQARIHKSKLDAVDSLTDDNKLRLDGLDTSVQTTQDAINVLSNTDVAQLAQIQANIATLEANLTLDTEQQALIDTLTNATNGLPELKALVDAQVIKLGNVETTVSTVDQKATTAINTANTASSAAQSASATAASASTVANQADTKASAAQNSADSADIKATEAKTNADSAVTTANTASTVASSAKASSDANAVNVNGVADALSAMVEEINK